MLPRASSCEEEARLLTVFQEAAATYERLVEDLANRLATLPLSEYVRAKMIVNEAQLLATTAWEVLWQHRATHGCAGR